MLAHLDTADIATYYLIKSLDTFLIAFVLFIFAHGVFTLFISNKQPVDADKENVLGWIKTPNIGHLKNVLAEVIVIILFVKFLILPVSILLLSLGLKFLNLAEESEDRIEEKE